MAAKHADTHETCFLCGQALIPANRSDEHFLPRWFPRSATERLLVRLANGTTTKPHHLLVPCCHECNGRFARVETSIAKAIRQGPDAVEELDRRDTAAWSAKILWGFAVFESRTRNERRDPVSGPILGSEQLSLLAPLQQLCQRWLFDGPTYPGSINAFHAQHEHRDDVDYLDDPPAGLLGVRLGRSAVVFSAVDHGDAQRLSRQELLDLGYLPVQSDLTELPLGPIQFREVFAWARTLQRSRPPFPPPGATFGPFDSSRHEDHMNEAIGVFPAFEGRSLGSSTFLFDLEMKPRFVSMSQTREWGREHRDHDSR